MSVPKAGYLSRAYLGAVQISGIGSWTYDGETRAMNDIVEFGENVNQLPCQKSGGVVTLTGNYLLDTDQGQKALKTAFDAKTQIANLYIYTDYDNGIYLQVKSGGHLIVTNVNNVGVDAAGIGTYTATFKVNGELEQVGSTTVVAVVTSGHVDEGNGGAGSINGIVTLIGELLHRGGETEDVTCYFEYGYDESNLAYTSDTDIFATPDVGKFADDIIELYENVTVYYRAVALLNDASKKYGAIKSVLIPAD